MASISLVSTQTHVESPFIIATIGGYTFGHCASSKNKEKMGTLLSVVYPNFMQSLDIVKINGAVNTYTLKMVYGITQFDDPNLLEKVFSSASSNRKIVLSYGDWNAPGYIYKEEEGIITKVSSNVDFKNSQIVYTVNCTSSCLTLRAGTFDFSARKAKPSDIIVELLTNSRYGLTNIFKGMKNYKKDTLSKFIAQDDKSVQLNAKPSMSVLDYISYLVGCMVCSKETGDAVVGKSTYKWSVYDDINNEYGGAYFKVQKVTQGEKHTSADVFEVDVGYPSSNFVTAFTLKDDNTWAILYDYADNISMPVQKYKLDDDGELQSVYSPSLTNSSKYFLTTNTSKNWWTQMTQFPVSATLTIKGLLRPALLMSYVRINTYFYGHKHVSSGLYIITKQQDSINSSGYSTTLSLTRVSGDDI